MCQVRLQVKYSLSGLDLRRTQPSHSWLFAARGAKPVESDGEYPRQFHGGRTCNVAENTRAHSASLGAGVPDFVGSLGSRFNLTEVGTSPKTPERTPHGQVMPRFRCSRGADAYALLNSAAAHSSMATYLRRVSI